MQRRHDRIDVHAVAAAKIRVAIRAGRRSAGFRPTVPGVTTCKANEHARHANVESFALQRRTEDLFNDVRFHNRVFNS